MEKFLRGFFVRQCRKCQALHQLAKLCRLMAARSVNARCSLAVYQRPGRMWIG